MTASELSYRNLKINFLGASGTGKSTLAKAVATNLGCPHFDSDDYFHFPTDPPFQKQRSPEERKALLEADLNKFSSWTLSGGAAVWEPPPKLDFSLVVFLYLEPRLRLERLRARELKLYGARILSGGDMEMDHTDFMEWTAGYDSGAAEGTNTLPEHERFLTTAGLPVLRLEGPLTTEEQVRLTLKALQNL
jgi:adenylate kinase family enzyme